MAENLPFEPAQLRSGFEAELVGEDATGVLEGAQGIGRAALPVPGGHQQRPPVLVEWFLGDEFLQRRLRLGEPSGRQLRLQPGGSRTGDERGEPRRRGPSVFAVGDVVEWCAVDQLQGCREGGRGVAVSILVGGLPARPSEPLEFDEVHPVIGTGDEGVAAAFGGDLGPGESATELGHLRLQGVGGRRLCRPQHLPQRARRDGVGSGSEQGREQSTLLRAPRRDVGAVVGNDGDGTEHVEPHHGQRLRNSGSRQRFPDVRHTTVPPHRQ